MLGIARWALLGYVGLALALTARLLASFPHTWPRGPDLYNLFLHPFLTAQGDWLWTSLSGAGHPLHAHPFSSTWYPLTTGPVALLGPELGVYAILLVHLVLGAVFFDVLARRYVPDPAWRFVGASIFLLGGCFASRVFAGHLVFLPSIAWAPLALHFLLRVADGEGLRPVVGAGVAIGVMLLGDVHVPLYMGLAALALMATDGFEWPTGRWALPRLRPRVLLALVAVFPVAAAVAAVKVLPLAEFSFVVGRVVEPLYASMGLYDQIASFLSNARWQIPQVNFEERNVFIGPLAFGLAIAGAFAFPEKRRMLALVAVLVIWIQGFFTPLGVLHQLPVLSMLRAPARAMMVLFPLVVLLAAVGLARLPHWLDRLAPDRARWLCRGTLALAGLQALEIVMPALVFLVMPAMYARFTEITSYDVRPLDLLSVVAGVLVAALVLSRMGQPIRWPPRWLPQGLALFIVGSLLAVNGSLFTPAPYPGQTDASAELAAALPQEGYHLVEPDGVTDLFLVAKGVPTLEGVEGHSLEWINEPSLLLGRGPRAYRVGERVLHWRDYLVTNATAEKHANDSSLRLVQTLHTKALGPLLLYEDLQAAPPAFVVRGSDVQPASLRAIGGGSIVIDAPALSAGERVTVKQTYYPGWTVSTPGFRVVDDQGMIAAEATADFAGGDVRLSFSPPLFWIGAAIAIPTLAAAAWVLAGGRAALAPRIGRLRP
ncbi:MAG TPA: hypothetical protein VM681_09285 [Candidatus Thermoplasmatota archaeon]|nr:hypothetical protein [Candidatus Thermoplasmatota archaeon]